MAIVTGPLYSVGASGTIGDAFTFGSWRGINWVRSWFKPANPQTAKQVNIRTGLAMLVEDWQELSEASKEDWIDFASGKKASGFNFYVGRGLDAYNDQLGTDNTPVTVSLSGTVPTETWTWSDTV